MLNVFSLEILPVVLIVKMQADTACNVCCNVHLLFGPSYHEACYGFSVLRTHIQNVLGSHPIRK